MASSDARPLPLKAVAYRVTFPIFDADGDLVTGAASLDSEVSKDGGTFADCTNEATEIATASGMYFLDLTGTEMDADTVAIIVKTATAGAKTTPLVLYPQEVDDIRVAVTHWGATAVATPTIAGVPEVDLTHWRGTAAPAEDTAGYPKVTIKDGTGAGELDTAAGVVLAKDHAGATLATAAAVAALNNLSAAQVKTEVVNALAVDTYAEPGQEAPPATTTVVKKLGYLYKWRRNKQDQAAAGAQKFYNDAGTTVDQKTTVTDAAGVTTRDTLVSGP